MSLSSKTPAQAHKLAKEPRAWAGLACSHPVQSVTEKWLLKQIMLVQSLGNLPGLKQIMKHGHNSATKKCSCWKQENILNTNPKPAKARRLSAKLGTKRPWNGYGFGQILKPISRNNFRNPY
jgi:hypothetical protein